MYVSLLFTEPNSINDVVSFDDPVKTACDELVHFVIATRAKFISFLIMNDTRNPDHDKKYRTNRAGTFPESAKRIFHNLRSGFFII